MDIFSLFGMAFAVGFILLGQHLEGGHLDSLLNGPAILIVLCGTLGAVCVETPFATFRHALAILLWIVFPPSFDAKRGCAKVVNWATVARKEGLLGLEILLENEKDAFAKKGLMLLVDGCEPNMLRSILENDIYQQEKRDQMAAKVYESMGGYSPTIGIIGAVLGLIHVMGNLSDPSKLGGGIAVAFVATIYGVGLANIFFLPIGNKLNKLIHHQANYCEMLVEGLIAISHGDNPRVIEIKLSGYWH